MNPQTRIADFVDETKNSNKEPDVLFSSMLNREDPAELQTRYPIENNVAIRVQSFETNVDQKFLTVTEDKILICLENNLRRIGRKRWVSPLSLLVSLLLALATSEFNKLAWISSDLLKALFIVTSFITTGWLLWAIMYSAKMREIPEAIKVIFDELRGESMKPALQHVSFSSYNRTTDSSTLRRASESSQEEKT